MVGKFFQNFKPIVSTYRNFSISKTTSENVVLYGIEPNGPMHIGNYYGSFKHCVQMQTSRWSILCSISDILSLSLPHEPSKLPENIFLTSACLIGCGLNPEKSIIFLQSQIPQHSQLCWILGCITDLIELHRGNANMPLGLYLRPVLQATDVCLFRSSDMCMGYDKIYQLPLVFNLIKKFNNQYGETFQVPRPLINGAVSFKNLRNPAEKMSKSGSFEKSRINLTDPPDVIFMKIKKAVTDMNSKVSYEPETRAGVSNLVAIHSAVTGRSNEELCQEAANLDTGMYKLRVAEALIEAIKPIQSKINHLLTDKAYLASVLKDGSEKAQDRAAQTWMSIREKIGSVVADK